MPEDMHVLGERGALLAKQWLEATTYFDIPHTAYGPPQFVKYKLNSGAEKAYDLVGRFMGDRKNEVACEVKNYTTEGGQGNSYREFLANSYSISFDENLNGVDRERFYFWITWHPFSVRSWQTLTSPEYIKAAVESYGTLAAGTNFDEDYAAKFAERVWINVLNRQLETVTLTTRELQEIRPHLARD